MNKYKDIFSKWMADRLIEKGHVPVKIRPNVRTPHYNVYVFVNSIGFDKDMTEIHKMRKFSAE